MSTASTTPPNTRSFGADPWYLHEDRFDTRASTTRESLFALGNGLLGIRGDFEEGYPQGVASITGTYWNGLYVRRPIHYGESAPGFPQQADFMPAVLDGRRLQLTVNGQALNSGQISKHQRWLQFGPGHSRRHTEWKLADGSALAVTVESWVSQSEAGLLAQRMQLRALNGPLQIQLHALLCPSQLDLAHGDDPRISAGAQDQLHWHGAWQDAEAGLFGASQRAVNADLSAVVALSLYPVATGQLGESASHRGEWQHEAAEQLVGLGQDLQLATGQAVILERLVLYRADVPGQTPQDQIRAQLRQHILSLRAEGYERLQRAHRAQWAEFWQHSDFALPDQPALEQGLRFNLFQLRQSCVRPEANQANSAASAASTLAANIGAKGLSGPGYDGHYFWDSEIYVLPLFSLVEPDRARALLRYRISKLDRARQRAREMSHPRGALFPWRTISGDECSAFFPAGTAQYHINADIAYALWRYARDRGDWDFVRREAAETLLETARIWLDLGHFNPAQGGQFTIHEVTGPDEYSAMVDNNFYTNALAARHLQFAADTATWLAESEPQHWSELVQRLGLSIDEVARWRQAAERIYLPSDPQRDLSWQDDRFAQRPPWDYQRHPADERPMLLKHHPLVLYRHQILKQADVLMAHFLCPEHSSLQRKANDYAYYEPLTTHDSSLSPCVHSIIASWIGQPQAALDYLWQTVRSDLDDLHHNSSHGLHIAAMAGSLACLYQGFAGLQLLHGTHPVAQTPFNVGGAMDCLRLSPTLPPGWSGYRLRFHQGEALFELEVRPSAESQPECQLRLLTGQGSHPQYAFALFLHGLATPIVDARESFRQEQARLRQPWHSNDWSIWLASLEAAGGPGAQP